MYVFKRSGISWSQIAYIKAVNADQDDAFGCKTDIDNSTIVVSANSEDSNLTSIINGTTASSDNSNSGNGAAYVYRFY